MTEAKIKKQDWEHWIKTWSSIKHPLAPGKISLVRYRNLVKKYAKGKDVVVCSDEKEMLDKFKEVMEHYDPDIVCGHNINGFDLPFIIGRMEMLGIQRVIGRTEKQAYTRKLQYSSIPFISGRTVVDTYEVYRFYFQHVIHY